VNYIYKSNLFLYEVPIPFLLKGIEDLVVYSETPSFVGVVS